MIDVWANRDVRRRPRLGPVGQQSNAEPRQPYSSIHLAFHIITSWNPRDFLRSYNPPCRPLL